MAAAADDVRPAVDYIPRAPFLRFHHRSQRWSVIVAHRRAGKTVACVMELLTRALATPKADARYAYIAPFYGQAKAVAWDYLKRYAQSVAVKTSESELAVELFNGSRIRLFGADNPDALRGMYLDGVVLDEFADMKPSLWGEVIRPLLADRAGWAVFIGTPKGRNSFYDLWDKARTDPDWFALTLKASETGLIAPAELADAKKSMTQAQYEQEFECSFEAAIIGAIYAKEIARAREGGRITSVPYDGAHLVATAWDIGYGDSTAIWFYQWVGLECRFIDYYEACGEALAHYMGVLKQKGYAYDTHWLPHDAENRQMATGTSVAELMRAQGFAVRIVANVALEQGINTARLHLPRCYFDANRCKAGLEALTHYRWDYNRRLDEVKPTPLHDWSSHGADAFRYAALSAGSSKPKPKWSAPIKYSNAGIV